MKNVFIIAEAGVNHNGSLKTAKKMIDAASKCGVNAVKFQTFRAEDIVSQFAPKAKYQKRSTDKDETHYQMIKELELRADDHITLKKYCVKRGVQFLSSPFDLNSIEMLRKLDLKTFKIPSGEITNLPYLRKIGALKQKVILSTGMSDLKEVNTAMEILTRAGTIKKNITILHCNSEYPTPMSDVNLKAMVTMRNVFKVDTGYSDHTLGIEVPIAAVVLGATVIEKHFTLDKKMKGPDHKASLDPKELKQMVSAIRNIEKALGDGIKGVSPSEMKNRNIARKSIVAKKDIKKGEKFSHENITAKRPGTGVSPLLWDKILKINAKKDFKKDRLIYL